MPSFIKDIERFYGDNSINPKGQDLDTFLELYDPNRYQNPSVTADILVFSHQKELKEVSKGLKLLLIKRKDHPCIGQWALPGGFVNIDEDTLLAAKRELQEETGLDNISVEQIYTWGEYDRDPRTRIVTVSYLALVEDELLKVKAGDDAADVTWADVMLEEIAVKEYEEDKKIKVEHTYELRVISKEKEFDQTAIVTFTENKFGLLKEKEYHIIDRANIAFDHARFITHGLLYIKNLL